jgi:hypothetical protein
MSKLTHQGTMPCKLLTITANLTWLCLSRLFTCADMLLMEASTRPSALLRYKPYRHS